MTSARLSFDLDRDSAANHRTKEAGVCAGVVAGEDLSKLPTLSTPQRRWCALSVRSRHEKKAHARLVACGIESFLPLIEEVHVWSDRKKRVKEPLFRGYLFVRAELRDRAAITQTAGVVRFVGIGTRVSWIPDEQIASVRTVAEQSGRIKRESYLSSGERVKVIAGPFDGVEGIIIRLEGSTRVVVSLDSIAQSVSVEVAPECLEKSHTSVEDTVVLSGVNL